MDVTVPCLFAGTVGELVLVVLFASWVGRRQDYAVFRRWRASMFMGMLMVNLPIVGLTGVVVIGGWRASQWQWSGLLNLMALLATTVAGLTCFLVPFAFLAAFGFYIRFMHGFDVGLGAFDWLDRIWHNPHAPAGPLPLVREERFR